ncbi:MAG: fumarylacetoacetate hydrolase family protein [Alphaproteobacteria bacterium]|nr:fumarylacetoacetate hydrolase family protein [Alphaproteobacteria bacterium]
MKIVNMLVEGKTRLGFLQGESVIDPSASVGAGLGSVAGWFSDTIAFIRAGEEGLAAAERLVADPPRGTQMRLADVKLTAPIRPTTILCSGSNYSDHNAEKSNTPISGKEPEFFVKTSDCVVGPDESIIHDPVLTKKLDCETELAIVIGKPGRHIPVDEALRHVFGYTIVNDVTARDLQVRTKGSLTWYETGRGKAFDSSAPLGPAIVTADEIGDPQSLQLRTRINGELRQSSTTANMIWTCAELVHFFSVSFTLKPGMVIITGTPAGTAWSTDAELGGSWQGLPGLTPATRYCLPGDVIESEIDKIGVLRNQVVDLASVANGA